MNTLVRAAVCAASGGVTAVMINVMSDGLAVSPAETNVRVERCVNVLGDTAIQAGILPEECKELEFAFDKVTVRATFYNADSRQVTDTDKVEYLLPPADEFKQEFVATEEDYKDYEWQKKRGRIGARILGVVVGVGEFALFTGLAASRRKVQAREVLDTSAVPTV